MSLSPEQRNLKVKVGLALKDIHTPGEMKTDTIRAELAKIDNTEELETFMGSIFANLFPKLGIEDCEELERSWEQAFNQ